MLKITFYFSKIVGFKIATFLKISLFFYTGTFFRILPKLFWSSYGSIGRHVMSQCFYFCFSFSNNNWTHQMNITNLFWVVIGYITNSTNAIYEC